MEFIKKNYEKIILSVVLLGLVGVVGFMLIVIPADQERVKAIGNNITHGKVQPLPPLDLSRQETVLNRLKNPHALDISTTNKLFNPVQWQRTKEGRIVKATGLGPTASVVTKIAPLYFIISLDSVTTNALGARYLFIVENQAAAAAVRRHPQRQYASKGEKNNIFTLMDVKGPPEDPTQLVLKLADTGETATISKGESFRRVGGYLADLKYDPDKLTFTGQRVGDRLSFGGDDYNIIAIDQNEVVLFAQSNQKKWNRPYAP